MSKFFRSGRSASSSNSESVSDDDPEVETSKDLSYPEISDALRTDSDHVISTPAANIHRDFLLHALLEERCMNEVLANHANINPRRRPSRDSSAVKAEANARYQQLCARLASYNLISTGLEDAQHTATRQMYRDGLDLLSQQGSTAAVPSSLKRLLTDTKADLAYRGDSNDADAGASIGEKRSHQLVPFPLRRLLTASDQNGDDSIQHLDPALRVDSLPRYASPSRSLFTSRYRHEYEELSVLGHGGYGVVYHVRHRLDNQAYAIKKVPLSATRLQRIQQRGQPELEEVLRELRTLARLDHPNIVRYFGGWIEWVDHLTSPALNQSHSDAVSNSLENTVEGAEDSKPDHTHRVLTKTSIADDQVLFEDSEKALSNDNSVLHLRRVSTRSTVATVSDETESVDHNIDPSISIQSATSSAQFAEPTLALHMQMSLHPMTLADFMYPPANATAKVPALEHCFHVGPSVDILLAIMNGIQYLHEEGIVHRDVKPANIFLGPHGNLKVTQGSVDLFLCNDCRARYTANPITLEVRIGDFGLVSVADPEAETAAESKAVGTEIYRPANAEAHSPSLDIYSLGIVAFELLWKFDTRMERIHIIQQLKQGVFPPDFSKRLGKYADDVKKCIEAMLSADDGISIRELKQGLSAIQATQ